MQGKVLPCPGRKDFPLCPHFPLKQAEKDAKRPTATHLRWMEENVVVRLRRIMILSALTPVIAHLNETLN